jgi:hypothetical protein
MARPDTPSLSRLQISDTDSTGDKKIPGTCIRVILGRQAGAERLWSLRVEIDSVQPPNLSISKTVNEVIYHADRLKVTHRHFSPHYTAQPKALYPKRATYG